MAEITSIQMGDRYNNVIRLDEYNGEISIVAARESKDGKIFPQWVFPQDKNRQPRDKAMPLKVTLGDRETAARHLRYLADVLEAGSKGIGGDELPEPDHLQPHTDIKEDDLPF